MAPVFTDQKRRGTPGANTPLIQGAGLLGQASPESWHTESWAERGIAFTLSSDHLSHEDHRFPLLCSPTHYTASSERGGVLT